MVGFWYLGEGNARMLPEIFLQMENDSDRAVGIVAASAVEQRLEDLLRSRFPQTKLALMLANEKFRSSAPLGSFSAKIDLAYLFGHISEEAQHDLYVMKEIRNRFAHRMSIDSFEHAEIKSRCQNLSLIDKHVGELSPEDAAATERGEFVPKPDDVTSRFVGATEKLKIPRWRFTNTALLFNWRLGGTADGALNRHGGFAI
ncbi:MltR family transcriptional regulator [Mesorhizobium sp.]|uniref:MltR family transcriptional regulator n=1 Tax=Mesorhizobium sp. TaxID=1871066 RepID=UPI0025E17A68|nr:MltR family transcriptional regulator [Mesorhizobium sp.]